MNGVILLSQEGNIIDYYGKQHPVPFAEHIPFWEYEPVQRFFKEAVGLYSTWTIGSRYTLFSVPVDKKQELTFGTPICFEDAFAYLCRNFILKGAEILVNLTNNSWSRTDSAQIQHFVAARFRSIENKRVLLRSTNSGFTSVVDPWGRIINSIPMFEEGYIAAEVPVYRESTFTIYTLLGDYFPLMLLILLFLYLALSLKKGADS
jgi:apolipoprotein N-acyltransferase